jgi:NAD(P)-dependent dehydrogenase (short-subunit alcohol dehydrogenase family)
MGLRLDVTRPDEAAAAVEVVRRSGRPLYAIVNNAGVVIIDPLLSMRAEDFDFQMQVNM